MTRMTGEIIERGRWKPVNLKFGHGVTSWDRNTEAKTSVAKLRYQLKMTQLEFAKGIGINSLQSISVYESGKITPSMKTAMRMIEFAKTRGIVITLDQFYRGDWEIDKETEKEEVHA